MANSTTFEDQNADLMKIILKAVGIEHESIEDFWKDRLESTDFTATKIYSRLHDAAEKLSIQKLEQHQLERLTSVLRKLFSPKKIKFKSREKTRKIFIDAIDQWNEKKKSGSAIYGKSFEGCLIQALCAVEEDNVFKPIYDEETFPPFHHAATKGDHDTVQAVVDRLAMSNNTEGDIIRWLSLKYKNETAFELAARHIHDNVVQLLFKKYPKLVDPVRSTKSSCIENVIKATSTLESEGGKKEGMETKQEKALKIFGMIIRDADDLPWLQHVWDKAVEGQAILILEHLMKEKLDSSFITHEKASFIIARGTYDMWQLFEYKTLKQFFEKDCGLLHDAVSYGQYEIVQDILKKFPQQIEVQIDDEQGKPKFALELLTLSKRYLSDESYDRLRDLLVRTMIKSDLPIGEIKDIGENSGVEVQSMALHLSNIDTTSRSFAEYIQSLKSQTSSYVKFETVLKYANFPDLDKKTTLVQGSSINIFGTDHSEINDAISWLKERQVEEIMELVVSDRLHSPHTDDQVLSCVNNLHVRILDWKKPDLYLPGLDTDYIQELTLYSSGNQSVIYQWCNELPKFSKLKQLHIYVIEDLVSDKRVELIKNSLKDKLKKIGLNLDDGDIEIDSCQWFSSTEEMTVYRNLGDITLDVAGKELEGFITKFKTHYKEKEQKKEEKEKENKEEKEEKRREDRPPRIKIALVDSGVVAVGRQRARDNGQPEEQIDISGKIVDGVSFASKGNREYLWWNASEPHGTQMATIICAMNPCCDLYVAKVAETKTSSLSAANVAKAIQWAIQKKVDIISLSLVVFAEKSAELMEAITLAKENDITVICSTADEGHSSGKGILNEPEYRDKVVSIAACNQHGKPLEKSQEDAFIYRFSGKEVQIGAVPFLKSDSHVTGSSVATAIAAATASLILSCCHISNKFEVSSTRPWKREFVIDMFNEMSDDVTSKQYGPWVRPHHLCGRNKLVGPFELVKLVEETYNQEYMKKTLWRRGSGFS